MVWYAGIIAKGIRGLSITNVALWLVSTLLTSVIIVRYTNFGQGVSYDPIGNLDYVFAGLWSGLFYGLTGLVGICASYAGKRSQLKAVIVLSFLSLAGSLTASAIAGTIGVYIIKNRADFCDPEEVFPPIYFDTRYRDCTTWAVLEYILMGFSIAAIFVNLFSLILSGTALQKRAKNFV